MKLVETCPDCGTHQIELVERYDRRVIKSRRSIFTERRRHRVNANTVTVEIFIYDRETLAEVDEILSAWRRHTLTKYLACRRGVVAASA